MFKVPIFQFLQGFPITCDIKVVVASFWGPLILQNFWTLGKNGLKDFFNLERIVCNGYGAVCLYQWSLFRKSGKA